MENSFVCDHRSPVQGERNPETKTTPVSDLNGSPEGGHDGDSQIEYDPISEFLVSQPEVCTTHFENELSNLPEVDLFLDEETHDLNKFSYETDADDEGDGDTHYNGSSSDSEINLKDQATAMNLDGPYLNGLETERRVPVSDIICQFTICGSCGYELDPEDIPSHFLSHVLRGSISQNDLNNGNPCTAIAAICILYAHKFHVSSFTPDCIDVILKVGNMLYAERLNQLRTPELNLTSNEIAGTFVEPCTEELVTINVLEEESMNGILNVVASPDDLPRLPKSIEEFIGDGSNRYAILTTNLLSMALIVQDGHVYLFDSHSRDAFGHPCNGVTPGKACLINFRIERAPQALSDHIHYICEFQGNTNTIPIEDVRSEDLQYYQYSITPVTIS